MRPTNDLEQQLKLLGNALRARPRLTAQVMQKIATIPVEEFESGLFDGTDNNGPAVKTRQRPTQAQSRPKSDGIWHWRWVGATAVGACLLALMSLVLTSSSTGWDEMLKAVERKDWMRVRRTNLDNTQETMWCSSRRKVWTSQARDLMSFVDGGQQARYEYRPGTRLILKLPLPNDDTRRLQSFDEGDRMNRTLHPWLVGAEKILSQRRRNVSVQGVNWIEFDLVFNRGDFNRGTLRVHPQSNLPVSLVLKSATDHTKSATWEFDFPEEGPRDIYALGVPVEARIADRIPSHECVEVLDAIAANRSRIGSFRLIAAEEDRCIVVHRQVSRWRIDACSWTRNAVQTGIPANQGREFYEQHIKSGPSLALYICNGQTVFQNASRSPNAPIQWEPSNNMVPGALIEGTGLLGGASFSQYLFPDLTPKAGWDFEFDPMPSGFPNCVLIKQSTAGPIAGSTMHEWHYLDRTKGFAVVRTEIFTVHAGQNITPESTAMRRTIVMNNFQMSPQGWWYAAEISDSEPVVATSSVEPDRPGMKTRSIRYFFDFDPILPANLFEIRD